jgi:5-methylcytosine-specific restriction enzyme subunit McrC
VSAPVVFSDLSPRTPLDAAEDQWLGRLAAHLEDNDHVLHLAGDGRLDDEDDPALHRGPDGNWWAGRFIGELRFEDREVRIEPRLGIDVVGAWLAHALNLAVVPRSATAASQGPLIVQLLDRVWSAGVADAARHGGPRLRRTSHHDDLFVRGRLDVPSTIRHRAGRRPLVGSIRTERDLDNPVARVLVLADRALQSLLPVRPTWRPTLTGEVLGQLRAVVGSQPELPDEADLRRVRYTPITRRFQPIARLSHEIAHRRGRLTSASNADASGVLVDVAELWELFLVHCARRAFGPTRVEHGTAEREGSYLLQSIPQPARRLGRLKPDILIRDRHGDLCAVIDAKYKRLRSHRSTPSGVDRGDLYQLTSYLSGHDVPLGALAYPPHDGDEAAADRHGPWTTRAGQRTCFVRIPATAMGATDALRCLVDEATAT